MREPKLIIATGTKGVGKTHTTAHVIERYIKANPFNGKKARKVLIYDVNMEWTDEELRKKGCTYSAKVLALKDLPQWVQQKRVEVRRIIPIDDKGQPLNIDQLVDLLEQILYYFRGGMLVLEDINKYLIDTRTSEIIGTMATNRHRDMDIYIHLQSLAPVTTRMWQNCQVVRFHKQMDDVNRYKQRLPNAELYFIVQKLTNAKYLEDNRFYCYIDNELGKIKGLFSKRDFQKAVYSYLAEHPKAVSNARKRFGSGKKGNEQAMEYCLNEKMIYYGNAA
jgi:hypothetical protein